MSNRELVKPYEPESADLFSNIRLFDKLVTNVWHQTLVCQTQIGISRYSSNLNPGFGSRIFDLAFTVRWCIKGCVRSLAVTRPKAQAPHTIYSSLVPFSCLLAIDSCNP